TGFLVAYAMNPAVRRLEKWGITRNFGTGFMILSFFFLIGLLLFIAFPFIQEQLLHLASRVPQYGQRIMITVQPLLEKVPQYVEPHDIERLRELASTYLGDVVTWGINLLAGIPKNGLIIANLI